MSRPSFWHTNLIFIYGFLVLLFAFFSFFWNYNYPNSSQWDEVYHIASAEKYLTNSVFMESHPPLGKMFIALGEKILNPNAPKNEVSAIARLCFSQDDWDKRPEIIDKSGFTKTDQIQSYPSGYSFCGVRLMPVLFAMFTAPLFFFLLYLLLRNLHLALLFSSLFVFDNAIILQSRAAMVDSIQIFFVILAIVYFVFKIEQVLDNLPSSLTNLFPNLRLKESRENKNTTNLSKIETQNKIIVENENENLQSLDKNLQNKNTTESKTLKNSKYLEINKKSKQIYRFSWQNYLLLGVFCGLSIITKHNAAIILVLPIAWFLFEIFTNRINLHLDQIWAKFRKQVLITAGTCAFLLLIAFFGWIFFVEQFSFIIQNLINSEFLVAKISIIFVFLIAITSFFFYFRKNIIVADWFKSLVKIASFTFGLIFLYLSVFSIHIASGQNVVPDSNNRNGYYLASDFYKQKLNQNQMINPINWPIAFWDNWLYMAQYHKGVPNLDLCKRDDKGNLTENGSYPMTWPVMNRTISFRWEWGTKDGSPPKDNKYIRYSYLIGNPLIWGIGLVSILLALVLIFGFLFFNLPLKNKRIFNYILVLTALYLAYMIGVLSVERVMYLYHYLIPLIFTLILSALLFVYSFGELDDNLVFANNFAQENPKNKPKEEIPQIIIETENLPTDLPEENSNLQTKTEVENNNSKIKSSITENSPYFWHYLTLLCCLLLVFACFAFFSPFTYYQPLSREEFLMREWFKFWQMRVVN